MEKVSGWAGGVQEKQKGEGIEQWVLLFCGELVFFFFCFFGFDWLDVELRWDSDLKSG